MSETHLEDRRDVMPGEVANLHTQMAYASPHQTYRQRHDARCYFCALLDRVQSLEAERDRLKESFADITTEWSEYAERLERRIKELEAR